MSYEVAQQVLDQLALATELFTAGYLGTTFTLYAWKRTAEPAKVPFAPPLSLPQPSIAEPLEQASKPKLSDPLALSLPESDSTEPLLDEP
jgi:hypothetical protein